MKSLLHSRKFWLSIFGCVQAIVLHYLSVPDDIWQSIAALVAVLIASIAAEDFALKHSGGAYEPAPGSYPPPPLPYPDSNDFYQRAGEIEF